MPEGWVIPEPPPKGVTSVVPTMNLPSYPEFTNAMAKYYGQTLRGPLSTNETGGLTYRTLPDEFFKSPGTGPTSLSVETHGYPPDRYGGFATDAGRYERSKFQGWHSELQDAANMIAESKRLLPIQKRKAAEYLGNISSALPQGVLQDTIGPKELAQTIGPATNSISSLINLACYAGGVEPSQWKSLFPNLTNILQSARELPTDSLEALRAFTPRSATNILQSTIPGRSPLINYRLEGDKWVGKPITSKEDWQ